MKPLSAGEIAGISVEAALAQVRAAFAERPIPVDAGYCLCDSCRDQHEAMPRILHSFPADLSDDDLEMLIQKAYWTGLDWPSALEQYASAAFRSVRSQVAFVFQM